MIRIVLADDHEIVREGLKRILGMNKDFEIVGEAGDGEEAIDVCKSMKPDVLLLDLDMPTTGGLEVLSRIFHILPNLKVLVLTMFDDEEYAIRALKEGASGYVLKGSKPNTLSDAIRKIMTGQKHISQALMEKLAMRSFDKSTTNPMETLTNREFQILKGVVQGEKLKETADRLNLSVSSVATYKKRIKDKLGMEKDSDLVSFAMRHKIMQ